MIVTFYGTRGSVPVSSPDRIRFGGNTTCLRVHSECLPANQWLAVDAGTGIVPLGLEALRAKVGRVTVLFTHYHHDHTQGLLLSPITFVKSIDVECYGPLEHGIGPIQMLKDLMRPPFFPVAYEEQASHFHGKGLDHPSSYVFVIHPEGGVQLCTVDELERAELKNPPMIAMRRSTKFRLAECLIIRMLKTNHPESTISYRFEERPTGNVFVFLTDHENLDGMPQQLQRHLQGADLLVMDSQYPRQRYDERTAGFGHGTPDYCVRVAQQVQARVLGLTHHDPSSTDENVEAILAEAAAALQGQNPLTIFACQDYQSYTV